ncbi:uncharacterized protein KY384_006589 [Bacidia gigantensis]|uniref:uncharacterized protein n=1 Tax=Bacidia gigantensis TaxID=2732470 RepID=UPI001D04D1DD|nr:uncharacterized protein KY384_006589 [Bacidia gigantensis]KAG8528900.1 hypothetical protein KY384_006589 [Bacidia gigantensis]
MAAQNDSDEWIIPSTSSEESRVMFAALDSFRSAHYNVTHRRRQNFYALPSAQYEMLARAPFNLLQTFERVDEAIDANADIAYEIIKTSLQSLGFPPHSIFWHGCATPSDLDKARSTLRQLYRDWSAEGAHERNACYKPVLKDLDDNFPDNIYRGDKSTVKVLVPGAGLGRLVFEICGRGYSVEGNEISWHQLMTCNWALNYIPPGSSYVLRPFATDFSNNISREHQLKAVMIPDVHVGSELGDGVARSDRMTMTASDFIVLYGDRQHQDTFDAVASVFFVDTAPNVIKYIEVIRNCLKEEGIWINLGPLLWHFAERGPPTPDEHVDPSQMEERTGIEAPGSFELTDEELLLLVENMGFIIEKREILDGQGYIQNRHSMLQNTYNCSHWIARKKPTAAHL